jgi:hypothetical protein
MNHYSVLIGSFARGDAELCSDLDIVRIAHTNEVAPECHGLPPVTPSYIDIDEVKFVNMYDHGRLFMLHILTEGRLLEGDPVAWDQLIRGFAVQTDFSSEIADCKGFLQYMISIESYKYSPWAYLYHLFRAAKNYAVFTLASKREYVFSKRESLRAVFGDYVLNYYPLMRKAEFIFDRNRFAEFSSDETVSIQECEQVISYFKSVKL